MSHFVSINYPVPPPTLSATFKNSKQSHTQQSKILTTDHDKDKAKKHNSKATSKSPNHQPSHTTQHKILTTNQHTDNNEKS